jgi:uncharacterized protein
MNIDVSLKRISQLLSIKMNTKVILLIVVCASIFACKPNDDSSNPSKQADRRPLVENLGDSCILPRYQSLNIAMNTFALEVDVFVANPSLTNLTTLRTKFLDVYTKWEYVAPFNFGPAAASNVMLDTRTVNVFPTDTIAIATKIIQGVATVPQTSSTTYSGFPAIDFLLYGNILTDEQVVDSFAMSINRCNYLKALCTHIKSKANTASLNWATGGSNFNNLYRNNTGLDLGSSTSQTINMMVYDIENCKNFKLGIPLNISQNTVIDPNVVNPSKSEGYYSESSTVLLLASIESIRTLYMGISTTGVDGYGFDDYLIAIDRAALNTQIKFQLNVVQTKLNAIGEPIAVAVQYPAGKQKVVDAYNETQNLLTLLKVDFASAVGILISYGDTDGD